MKISSRLNRIYVQAKKLSTEAREAVRPEELMSVSPKKIAVIRDPFPHIIVDDFFLPGVYAGLCSKFNDAKKLGFSEKKGGGREKFTRFEVDYDGYIFTPRATLDPEDPISIFFTLGWNMLFSRIFNISTDVHTAFAFHHHPAGDRTGFIHHDSAPKFFTQNPLQSGVIPYASDRESQGTSERWRQIALIFYLENDGWREGDGGETGLYSKDQSTLLSKVAPINNRLFAFQISRNSQHAFQHNLRERNTLIQWFHAPKEWIFEK